MSNAFGPDYAASYDALYADKDYDAECDLLEGIFRRSARPVRSVLDLGSGTGSHSIRLAQQGFEVVGVDASAAMLDVARRRAEDAGPIDVNFVEGDIRSVRLDRQFDAVICMFAVLGYQTSDDDVAAALATVRTHLAPAGPFVFDVWYGPAVEAIGPSTRSKLITTTDGELERQASASLEKDAHLCTVSYRLIRRRPGLPVVTTDETHKMRYFFEDELSRLLTMSDLSLVRLTPFPEVSAPLTPATWNAMGIAEG